MLCCDIDYNLFFCLHRTVTELLVDGAKTDIEKERERERFRESHHYYAQPNEYVSVVLVFALFSLSHSSFQSRT